MNNKPSSTKPENAKIFADAIMKKKDIMVDYAADFKINSATMDSLGPGEAFVYKMEYRVKNTRVSVEQAVLFHKNQTYVVTCTSDSNEYMEDKNWCRNVIDSMRFAD